MHVAATEASRVREILKPLALEQNNMITVEPLVTPTQADQVKKANTASFRRAIQATKKRKAAVAVTPTANGTTLLSAELQRTNGSAIPSPVPTELALGPATGVNAPGIQRAPPRARHAAVSPPPLPTVLAVPPGPPQKAMSGVRPWRCVDDKGNGASPYQTLPQGVRIP